MKDSKDISQWNRDDFRYFVERYGAIFLSFARRYTGEKQAAEDIVQDCLCRLWVERERRSAAQIRNVPVFVLVMIRNRALNHIRKQNRIFASEFDPESYVAHDFTDRIIARQNEDIIYGAVESLPENWRKIMRLVLQGMGNKEIAELSGVSIDSVKAIKTRAIARLREMIPPEIKSDADWP